MINVSDIDKLYSAIHDTGNEGGTVVLAPGTYVLSASAPDGSPRPNGGRLELQLDMSIRGQEGDRSAVKIDTSRLPLASLNTNFGPGLPTRTGAIRIGRGVNSIEWLTIIGNPQSASGIETDLGGTATTMVRIAHVVSGGSTRGVDIRNIGEAMNGRRIDAEVEDNDLSSGSDAIGTREGIRIANFIGPTGGQIYAIMNGNIFHHSPVGCLAVNNRTNSSLVDVRSNGDRFENNETGCLIAGSSVSAGASGAASVIFEAHGGKFKQNKVGLYAVGAEAGAQTNVAVDTTVSITLFGCKVSDNEDKQFEAYGARSTGGIPGTNNKVRIELKGISRQIDVDTTNCEPPEPAGTNTVEVIR